MSILRRRSSADVAHVAHVAIAGIAAALAVGGAAGCPDYVPPDDARIGCAQKSDCPDQWHCNAVVSRCIPDDLADRDAPKTRDVALPSTPQRAGAAFAVAFTVDEPVGVDPVVDVDGAAADLDDANTDRAHLRFAFTYTVSGDELGGAGGDAAVHVRLSDTAGNEGVVTLGTVALDFTPPEVQPIALGLPPGNTAVQPVDDVDVSTTTEPGATLVSANVVDESGAVLAPALVTASPLAGPPAATALAGHAALAGLALPDGARVAVDLVVADAAGNETAPGTVRSGFLTVDATPPSGTLAFVPSAPITATPDVALLVTSTDASFVCFRGDVVPTSACTANADFAPLGDGNFTATLSVAEGAKTVEAVLRDGAFNESTGVTASIAYVSAGVLRSQPQLVLPAGQTAVKDGDVVEVGGAAQIGASVVAVALVDVDAGFAVVQTAPPATVEIGPDGALAGSFVADALPDGHHVALEIDVSVGALLSDPVDGRSAAVLVDDTPPQSATVAVEQGAFVSATGVRLVLDAAGATEMFIDGDVVDAANVRAFVPFASIANVLLTTTNGLKNITVRFRDGAHNEAIAAAAVTLDRTVPGIAPAIASPHAGVAGVRAGDVVTVQGAADADTALDTATLRFLDTAGAPLAGGGCQLVVTNQLTLVAGALGGSVNVGVPCAGAASVDLQVIVRTAAGVLSDPIASTTAPLFVDVTAPSGSASLVADVSLHGQAGFTRSRSVSLVVAASDDSTARGGALTMILGGDVVGVTNPVPVPANGSLLVDLLDVDGVRTVTVQFVDDVGNAGAAQNAIITLDRVPPLQPQASKLRLREQSDAPDDPAQVADAKDRFFVSADAGAIVNGVRAFAYADAGLTQRIRFPIGAPSTFDLPANGGNGFDEAEVPNDGTSRVFVVAVDAAGNESAATAVAVPVLTFGSVDSPHGSNQLIFTFTSSAPLAAPATVVVAGRAGTCGNPAPTMSCFFAPSGGEPEGVGRAVVRLFADAPGFAPGTTGTDAVTMTFDFTPPTVDAAKLVVVESDPGAADQIAGLPGAVTDFAGADDVTATTLITAAVFTAPGGTGTRFPSTGPILVAPDGLFGPIDIGDNVDDVLFLRIVDDAGNVSEASFSNDKAAPVTTLLASSPSIQKSGGAMTITFTVSDDAHDLRANPVVTVGGRAATLVSGSLGTSTAARAFTYTFTPQAGTDTEGTRALVVTATDAVGNASTASINVVLDFTVPTVADALPGVRATWNGSPSINGTASDGAGSGVARVELSLKDTTANAFFDGAAFSSATKVFVAASGTTSWTQASAPPYIEGHGYALTFRAFDVAGNVSVEGGPLAWTDDVTTPDTSFATPPPASTTSTSATYALASEPGATFECALDGASFAACPASATLTDVALGPHTLRARAIDEAGNVDPSPATAVWTVARTWRALAAGDHHVCGIAQDGSLWCWGDNQQSALGTPTPRFFTDKPVQVGTDRDWSDVAAATQSGSCAVKTGGTLWCWGLNASSRFGVSSFSVSVSAVPLQIGTDADWVDVAMQDQHTCAIKASGALFCWGDNFNGQLGDPALPLNQAQATPHQVGTDVDWRSVSVGVERTVAVKTDGRLFCFGNNRESECGQPVPPTQVRTPTQIGTASDFESAVTGSLTTCALSTAGEISCVGSGAGLGDGVGGTRATLAPIAGGRTYSALTAFVNVFCAVVAGGAEAGALFCWGESAHGESGAFGQTLSPTRVGADADWVDVAAGGFSTCGRKANGDAFCFGGNGEGQLGGAAASKASPSLVEAAAGAFAAGSNTTCITTASGEARCAGASAIGDGQQLPRATLTPVVGGAQYDSIVTRAGQTCARRVSDATVDCWGLQMQTNNTGGTFLSPTASGSPAVTALAEGGNVALAIATDGTALSWGANGFGQLGDASGGHPNPLVFDATPGWTVVAGGGANGAGIRAGHLLSWGGNLNGVEAGVSTTENPIFPTDIGGANTWTTVGLGDGFGCAITTAGEMFCWGFGGSGQLGLGGTSNLSAPTSIGIFGPGPWRQVAGGSDFTCAVKADSTLWCWGDDNFGQLGRGVGSGRALTPLQVGADADWDQVACGAQHACARKTDGRLFCWGRNDDGEIPDGTAFTTVPVRVVDP